MSWPMAALGDVAEIVTGKTPKTSVEEYFGGDIPFATPSELDLEAPITITPRTLTELGATQIKLVPKNSVLVCCIGSLGKVAIAGRELATNQQINSVIFNENKVVPRYGYYACRRLKQTMETVAPATTVKIISKSKFSDLEIPLPPLAEQKRIAGILDQADALRRLRRRAVERLDTLGQAIFHEMFGGNRSDTTTVQLADLIAQDDKINYGVVQPGNNASNGVPLIRVGDLLHTNLNRENWKRISPEVDKKYSRSRLNGSEILIACVGSVGAISLATAEVAGANIARAVARVPLEIEKADRNFVAAQLRMPEIQRYFGVETRAVAQPTLNIKQIKETKIVLPDMARQLEFSEKVGNTQKVKASLTDALADSETLFASLQQRAFRGEL